MHLNDLIQQILTTGLLPCDAERQLEKLLRAREFDEAELAAMEQLLGALCRGAVKPIG